MKMSGPFEKHALVFSQPMFGHLIPLLELSKKLADRGFHVTFVVSELRLPEMIKRALLPPRYSNMIDLCPLKDGVDADVEAKVGPNQYPELVDQLREPITNMIKNAKTATNSGEKSELKSKLPVDLVLSDIFMCTPANVCYEVGVPCYPLYPNPLFIMAKYGNIWQDMGVGTDDDFYYTLPEGQSPKLSPTFKKFISMMEEASQKSDGLLVNSVREIEGPDVIAGAQMTPMLKGRPVWLIGPLLQHEEKTDLSNSASVLLSQWLDKQEFASAVYVSFGSMVTPAPAELNAILQGLLPLKKPFIWSLRADKRDSFPDEIRASISTQNSDSPFLILPWVNQKTILAHPSVRLFMSHCGWNSSLETVAFGKPVVGWPMFGDQPMNAEFLEKLNVAVRISGTCIRMNRTVEPDEVANAIRKVAGWDGEEDKYVVAARDLSGLVQKAIAPGGSSIQDFESSLHWITKKLPETEKRFSTFDV